MSELDFHICVVLWLLPGSSKSPLLTDIKFDFQGRGTSSTNSPVEVSGVCSLSRVSIF
jgi:hypothetical protein